jgi:hypothetical protein
MSKGLGRIERIILRLLQIRGGSTDEMTIAVYRVAIPEGADRLSYHQFVTAAQRSAVRRALASLKRKGLVEDSHRYRKRSQRIWSLLEAAPPEVAREPDMTMEEVLAELVRAVGLDRGLELARMVRNPGDLAYVLELARNAQAAGQEMPPVTVSQPPEP